MVVRKGEEDQTRFRSERIYMVNNDYFFSTREGIDRGPFVDKTDAESALESYISSMGETEKSA